MVSSESIRKHEKPFKEKIKFLEGRLKYYDAEHTKEVLENEKLQEENKRLRECVQYISDEGWWGRTNSSGALVEILDEHKKAADKCLKDLGV